VDIMIKGLPTLTFSEFRSSLCVAADPSTAGGVLRYVRMCIGSLAPKVLGSLVSKACKVPWLSRLYDSYIYTRQPALLELCNLP
jgi:hypothetical protein